MNPDFYERYYDECYDLHKRRYIYFNLIGDQYGCK